MGGLNSRLVNLERINKMESGFDKASQNLVHREKDRKYKREVKIHEERINKSCP